MHSLKDDGAAKNKENLPPDEREPDELQKLFGTWEDFLRKANEKSQEQIYFTKK